MTLTASLDELDVVVDALDALLPVHAVVSLRGDLAAGKTTLVQAIAARRGYGQATSPTFSLQHVYGDDLFHYDLYRIGFEELAALGLIEGFEMSGWHLVEWMDADLKRLLLSAGMAVWEVAIEPNENGRVYRIESIGS
jgi:tRNA threonylcarbamoyladenosine biosynthesis protein TsaE